MKAPPRLEKHFQTAVLKRLRKLPRSYWIKLNDRATIGLPDVVGWILSVSGRCYAVAIELKTQSNLTKLQEYTLGRMAMAGVRTFVVYPDDWDRVFMELEALTHI